MTTKLNLIKNALRESIEMANKATPQPWGTQQANALIYCKKWVIGSMECHEMLDEDSCIVPYEEAKANATFIAHARTMTPLACKALLTAIEGLEFMNCDPQYGWELCDNDGRGCPACEAALKILESITSEWPDV
jgi:hypothetical protein